MCVPKRLCDNPHKNGQSMRLASKILTCLLGFCFASSLVWAKSAPQAAANAISSVPLVLTGGTVVDVTNWGHSARDLQNAVVIIRDGHITDVGTPDTVAIPKGARVIDCTGKFIIPGLVDGFTG